MTRPTRCPSCGHRPRRPRAYDLRGAIAVGGIILVFGLAFTLLFTGVSAEAVIPPWAASFLTLVVNSYYMSKSAERHASALTAARDRRDETDRPPG